MTTIVSTILKYNQQGTAGIVGENPYRTKAKFSEIGGLEYTDKLNKLTQLKWTVANNEYTRANAFLERNAYFPLITPYRGIVLDSAKDKKEIALNSTELAFHLTRRVFRNDEDDEVSYTTEKWFNKLWRHRARHTVKKIHVSDEIKQYPMNVNLPASEGFRVHAQLSGDDFLVTSDDGITQIPHEIQNYDSITGKLVLWIKLPKVSDGSNTDFYIYYDNPAAANQEDIVNVWKDCYTAGSGDSETNFDYNMVQHLHDGSVDSTENDNDGTDLNITYVAGQIGNAAQFNATTSEIDCGADTTIANIFKGNQRTMEGEVTNFNDDVLANAGGDSVYLTKFKGLIPGSKVSKVQISVVTSAGNIRFKMYDHVDGFPANLLTESGSLAVGGTGVKTYALNDSITVPDNGILWIGLENDNNTLEVRGHKSVDNISVGVTQSFLHAYGDGPATVAALDNDPEDRIWYQLLEQTQTGGGWVSCWINPNSDGEANAAQIYSKNDATGTILIVQNEVNGFMKLRLFRGFTTTNGDWITTSALIPIDKATKIDVIYNETDYNNIPKLFINGIEAALTTTTQPTVNDPVPEVANELIIGNENGGARTFDGEIEEVRVMNVIPPNIEDIIKTNYNIENQPTVCISIHSHEEYARQADLIAKDIIDSANQDMPTLDITKIDNLLALWRLDNNSLDSKGSNSGTWTGTEKYSDNTIYALDKSGDFDGSSNTSSTVSGLPIGSADRSIVFLMKKTLDDATQRYTFGYGEGVTNKMFGGFINANEVFVIALFGDDRATNTVFSNDIWYHMVVTLGTTGTVSNIYIDGELDSNFPYTHTGTANTTSSSFRIGSNFAQGGRWTGQIDDMRIYDRELTAIEARALFQATQSDVDIIKRNIKWRIGEGEPTEISNLVSLHKFDNDLIDSKGKNDGTIIGGVEAYEEAVFSRGFFGDGVRYVELDPTLETNYDFDRTDSFSVSARFKIKPDSLNHMIITKMEDAAPFIGWDIYINTAGKVAFQIINDASVNDQWINATGTTAGLDDNKFHTIILTYDGTSNVTGMTLMVDGVIEAVTAPSTSDELSSTCLNNFPAVIGSRHNPLSHIFIGILDDVRVYDKVLSLDEQLTITNATDSGINLHRDDNFPTITTSIGFNFKKHWEALDELALQLGKDLWFDDKNFRVNIGTKGKVIDEKLDIVITSKPEKKTENFANIINVVGKKESGGNKIKKVVTKETVQRYNYEKVISNNKIGIEDQLGTIADSLIKEFQVLTPQIKATIPYDQFMRFDIQSGDTIRISEPDKDISGVFRFMDIVATRESAQVTLEAIDTGVIRHRSSSLSDVLGSVLKKLNENSLSS